MVWRSERLRPLGLTQAAGSGAEWMWYTAATVYAHELGGVPAVGVIAVASVLPAAVLAPVLSSLVDRYPRHRVLTAAVVLRAAATVLAAISFYTHPSVPLLAALTAVEGVGTLLVRPATTALLPFLTIRPGELVSAQATLGAVENGGLLVGSITGGVLLAATSPGIAFTTAAGVALIAVAASARVEIDVIEDDPPAPGRLGDVVRDSLAGFSAIVADRAWLVSLFSASALVVSGATEVVVVSVALDLLDLSAAGPGVLTACIGLGGIIGATVMSARGGRRLGVWMVLASALIGAPFLVTRAAPVTGVVVAVMVVLGAGLTITSSPWPSAPPWRPDPSTGGASSRPSSPSAWPFLPSGWSWPDRWPASTTSSA
jgi:MFS family permease